MDWRLVSEIGNDVLGASPSPPSPAGGGGSESQ